MKSSGGLFPVEIFCKIFCCLDPLEVVRLRAQFREITYDLGIWKTLYVNARLPRPPGPFPHQSASFLERTLIRSAWLAKSWTTQRIQDNWIVKVRMACHNPALPGGRSSKMIAGRWHIGCQSYRQFVLHDTESPTSPPKVLCECEGAIFRWDAAFVTSPEGELVYVVFAEKGWRESQTPLKLVECRLNTDSGELYDRVSLDVPTWNFSDPWISMLRCYRGPLIYIPSQQLVFDTRTRIFYKFPQALISTSLNTSISILSYALHPIVTTSTHIIVLVGETSYYDYGPVKPPTLVQVFALPTDPGPAADNTCILHLTHEATMPAPEGDMQLISIRDSAVDPTSGSTRLTFLHPQKNDDGRDFQCVTFTLSKPDPDLCVLPISIHTHHLFSVKDDVRGSWPIYIETSSDGYTRGLCLRSPNRVTDRNDMSTSQVMRFTIDASGDECTGTRWEVERPTWNHIRSALCFDGVRGRIYWFNEVEASRGDSPSQVDILVVDIK